VNIKSGIIAFLAGISMASAAFSQDLPQQPGCGFQTWNTAPPLTYRTVDKQMHLNEVIQPGDATFYATFINTLRVYQATGDIQFKDRSPLNRDLHAVTGDRFPVVARLTTERAGETYDVIPVGGGIAPKYFLVKPDGFVCGERLSFYQNRFAFTGMPMNFQAAPLAATTVDAPNPINRALAVTLLNIVGPIANFQVSLIENGQPVRTVTRGFDVFGGNISLNGLAFKVKKVGTGVLVTSVSEPANYYSWIDAFFSNI
jgi:hypothetical protein